MAQRQDSKPLVIHEGRSSPLLTEEALSEDWFQRLLYEHPSLIPVADLEPVFAPLLMLGREVRTPVGRIDLLCVSPSGFLTVVETKLRKSSEARRDVIAQAIDYASAIARWSYEDLVKAVLAAQPAPGLGAVRTGDPVADIASGGDEKFDRAHFVREVRRNLERGRFLLIIVGDGVREEVEHLVEYMGSPYLRYTLALVEMAVYRLPQGELLVLPRTIARTKEVERAVIELRAPLKPEDVAISISAIDRQASQSAASRPRITAESFFEQLSEHAGAGVADFARRVLTELEKRQLVLHWGDSSVTFKFAGSELGDIPLGAFSTEGHFNLARLMAGCRNAGIPLDMADRYLTALLRVMPDATKRPWGKEDVTLRRKESNEAPPLAWLIGKEAEFLAAIDAALADLATAVNAASPDTTR